MASTKSKKNVISQEKLRSLMRQKQYSTKSITQKISHPYAKYNNIDQLCCSLCCTVIKSDHLWSAHIQGIKHKEIQKCSATRQQLSTKLDVLPMLKRKLPDPEVASAKHVKGGVASDDRWCSDTSADNTPSFNAVDDGDDRTDGTGHRTLLTTAASESVPADFFDASSTKPDNIADVVSSKPTTMADLLPEGFFDDPKMDAKVRHVIYKDKAEEEWDLFQKSIKEESHVSEAIMEEEDEQTTVERNLDEIDEQMQRWQEVENLHVKKETIQRSFEEDQHTEDTDELGVDDLDRFLDWRAKKSWR